MMNFEEAKATKALLENHLAETNAALALFPRSAMGLTPDEVKFSWEFLKAKAEFKHAFEVLRTFNGYMMRTFSKEMRRERLTRRAG